jgi:hypothetical protein
VGRLGPADPALDLVGTWHWGMHQTAPGRVRQWRTRPGRNGWLIGLQRPAARPHRRQQPDTHSGQDNLEE